MSDREQRIRERAYHIWEQEGRPHGRDEEFWRRAADEIGIEDELAANGAPPAEAAKALKRAKPKKGAEKPAPQAEAPAVKIKAGKPDKPAKADKPTKDKSAKDRAPKKPKKS